MLLFGGLSDHRDRKNDGLKGHLQDEYNMAKVKKHIPPGNVT
jgi:hypothetical protein